MTEPDDTGTDAGKHGTAKARRRPVIDALRGELHPQESVHSSFSYLRVGGQHLGWGRAVAAGSKPELPALQLRCSPSGQPAALPCSAPDLSEETQ